MKPEDHNGKIDHREDATEEFSLDGAAKGLASGTLSRPRALRMAGAALLSAALLPLLPKHAQAADNFTTRCDRKGGTVCRTAGAGKICCPEDSICGQVLGGDANGVCVKRASIDWQKDCGPTSGSLLCPQGKVCATCSSGASMGRGLCAKTVSPIRIRT